MQVSYEWHSVLLYMLHLTLAWSDDEPLSTHKAPFTLTEIKSLEVAVSVLIDASWLYAAYIQSSFPLVVATLHCIVSSRGKSTEEIYSSKSTITFQKI